MNLFPNVDVYIYKCVYVYVLLKEDFLEAHEYVVSKTELTELTMVGPLAREIPLQKIQKIPLILRCRSQMRVGLCRLSIVFNANPRLTYMQGIIC